MSNSVLLLTNRPAFEEDWRRALERVGLQAEVVEPEAPGSAMKDGSVLVVDAACEVFDEDELLAYVGLAHALHASCAVALPDDDRLSGIEDLLDDLCPGLVVRNAREVSRVAAALARRSDRERAKRFEYVAVSPRPGELLAIRADGSTALLSRPVSEADDGSEIASIALGAGAATATLVLASGREVELRAGAQQSGGARQSVPPVNGHGSGEIAIDGVRLGARLRELRVAAGLTQAELARRTGIHRPNIARVEAGRHTPSLETLARLASAIGVPTTLVLAEE